MNHVDLQVYLLVQSYQNPTRGHNIYFYMEPQRNVMEHLGNNMHAYIYLIKTSCKCKGTEYLFKKTCSFKSFSTFVTKQKRLQGGNFIAVTNHFAAELLMMLQDYFTSLED